MDRLDIIAKLMQIVTAVAAVSIGFIVYRHNRRKDKESVRERAWNAQQQLNFSALNNIGVLKASEFTIDGIIDHNLNDEDLRRALYVTFIQMNRIHLLWNGWRAEIFTREELDDEVRPTLQLIAGNPMLTNYCLTRGYDSKFVDFITEELNEVDKGNPKPECIEEFLPRLRKSYKECDSHESTGALPNE